MNESVILSATKWSRRISLAFVLAFFLAACGDDDISFAPRDDESSSSIEDVTPQSSERETSVSSSSKNGDAGTSAGMTSSSAKSSSSVASSSSAKSSSSSAKSSSSEKSSSSVASSSSVKSSSSVSSSSEYVPFDHSKTLGYQKFEDDGYKTFTDPRNGRSYYYITIYSEYKGYSVTVMAENLNIGDMVLGENDQNDDTKIERYCYNNDTTKCDEFGGLYQWAEMMQLPSRCNTESCAELIQENHQGICPDGWRLFTYDDYCVVMGYDDPYNDGVKGLRSTYGFSGTNNSGFSLTGAGQRTKKGGFDRLKKTVYWFYPQEHEYDEKLYVRNGYISAVTDHTPSADDGDEKVFGFSVRCVMVENQAE